VGALVEMELDLPKLLPALGTMPVPNASGQHPPDEPYGGPGSIPASGADKYTAVVVCLAARGMWSAGALVEMELDLPQPPPALGTTPVPNASGQHPPDEPDGGPGSIPASGANKYTAVVVCLAARGMWSVGALVEMELDLPQLPPSACRLLYPSA